MEKPSKRITLVATDADGTLLGSDGQISSVSRQTIQEAHRRGIRIILATTRNQRDVQDFATTLEIDDPIICANGSQVFASPEGTIWANLTVPRTIALRLAHLADEMEWEMVTTVDTTSYYKQRPGQSLGSIFGTDRMIVATNSDGIVGDAIRILVWQPDAIRAFCEKCEAEFSDSCYTTTFYKPDGSLNSLGVFAHGADKGNAMQLVLSRLGIPVGEVMAVGDNDNDLPMFTQAGFKVAVSNGTQSLKDAADVIAPTNDEDGVGWAIRKYILIGN
jgi:hypothetical protein